MCDPRHHGPRMACCQQQQPLRPKITYMWHTIFWILYNLAIKKIFTFACTFLIIWRQMRLLYKGSAQLRIINISDMFG